MWTMLNNGVCPPEVATFGFTNISAGYNTHMAIDNAGRLYTWGSSSREYGGQTPVPVPATPNFTRNPVTFRSSDGNMSMTYPYQVGIKNNWVKCDHWEFVYVALDADGKLYAWGEDDTFGRGGWALGSQYQNTPLTATTPFTPGGEQAITPQLINNDIWADFAAGQYHMLGLKADKSLWIWGTNTGTGTGLAYGSASYTIDFVSRIPIRMDWVPGPVKLISAQRSVCAIVTESDTIYAWGDWNNSHFPEAVPTLRTFAVPTGETIVDIKCSQSGIVILISNGAVYAQGNYIGFSSSDVANFALAPGEHNFVQISVNETGAAGVDAAGNIWAWGNQEYLISNEGGNNLTVYTPPAATALGNTWKYVDVGSVSHMAIDTEGRLFTWGNNIFGLLGINKFQSEQADSFTPVQCNPILLDNGEAAAASVTTAAVQIVIPSPKQISEHNPCGHWHRQESEVFLPGEVPYCCWNFPVAIDGANVVLYGLGTKYPWPMIALRYNISTRIWSDVYWQKDNTYSSDYIGGASLSGDFDGLMTYCADISGARFTEGTKTNYRLLVKTGDFSTRVTVEKVFYVAPQNCEGKISISPAGTVIVLVETTLALEIWSGLVLSPTYTLVGTISVPVDMEYYYARIVRTTDSFYVGYFYGDVVTKYIDIAKPDSEGVWSSVYTITAKPEAEAFNMYASGGTIYVQCHDQLFFSSDGAITFTTAPLNFPSIFGVANSANSSALIFYNHTLQKTLNLSAAPTWQDYPVIPTIPMELAARTVIKGSGDNVVYMKDNVALNGRVVMPVSQNLGETWDIVETPIAYFVTEEDAFHGEDDPRWKFSPQEEKIPLDPQYR